MADIVTGGGISAETDPIIGAITGLVKADGGGNISAAVADADYSTPAGVAALIDAGPTTQTATAGSAVTTLTLTPSATLTDGIYEVIFSIKSASGSAIYRIYWNGDTTNSNYRTGATVSLVTSAGGAETSDAIQLGADLGSTTTFRGLLTVKHGTVTLFGVGVRQRASTSTGRVVSYASWKTSSDVTSIQATSDIASAIDTGSFIKLRRVY